MWLCDCVLCLKLWLLGIWYIYVWCLIFFILIEFWGWLIKFMMECWLKVNVIGKVLFCVLKFLVYVCMFWVWVCVLLIRIWIFFLFGSGKVVEFFVINMWNWLIFLNLIVWILVMVWFFGFRFVSLGVGLMGS